MIIVKRNTYFAGGRSVSIALCEPIRKTAQRVYVNPINPTTYTPVIMGGRNVGHYCALEDVLTWDGTEAQFAAMQACLQQAEQEEAALQRQIRELYDATDRKLYRIAVVESAAIQENTHE